MNETKKEQTKERAPQRVRGRRVGRKNEMKRGGTEVSQSGQSGQHE